MHAQVQRAVLGCADLLTQRITAKLKYCDALEAALSRERDSLQASFAADGSCAHSTASCTAQMCVTCCLTWHGRASRATVFVVPRPRMPTSRQNMHDTLWCTLAGSSGPAVCRTHTAAEEQTAGQCWSHSTICASLNDTGSTAHNHILMVLQREHQNLSTCMYQRVDSAR